jgi:copper homeostasis protein
MTRDLDEALEALVALGVDRVLTSGGEATVIEGVDTIAGLVRRAGNRCRPYRRNR